MTAAGRDAGMPVGNLNGFSENPLALLKPNLQDSPDRPDAVVPEFNLDGNLPIDHRQGT